MRGLIPTETQMICGAAFSAVGSAGANFLGWNQLVEALMAAMVIDYVTGVLAAYKYKRKHPKSKAGPNSRRGALGIVRKVSILCIVAFAHFLDHAMGTATIHTVIVWFYIGNEGLSVIENAAKAGAPIPRRLRDTLEQLAYEKEERAQKAAGMKGAGNDGKGGNY